MIEYLSQPLLKPCGAGRFQLYEGIRIARYGAVYEVPKGFVTDGASIPPIFWPLVGHPYSPSSLRAAILHDRMCRAPHTHPFDSSEVHAIFFEALRADGVAWLRAWLMWKAVALFGPRFKSRDTMTE